MPALAASNWRLRSYQSLRWYSRFCKIRTLWVEVVSYHYQIAESQQLNSHLPLSLSRLKQHAMNCGSCSSVLAFPTGSKNLSDCNAHCPLRQNVIGPCSVSAFHKPTVSASFSNVSTFFQILYSDWFLPSQSHRRDIITRFDGRCVDTCVMVWPWSKRERGACVRVPLPAQNANDHYQIIIPPASKTDGNREVWCSALFLALSFHLKFGK